VKYEHAEILFSLERMKRWEVRNNSSVDPGTHYFLLTFLYWLPVGVLTRSHIIIIFNYV